MPNHTARDWFNMRPSLLWQASFKLGENTWFWPQEPHSSSEAERICTRVFSLISRSREEQRRVPYINYKSPGINPSPCVTCWYVIFHLNDLLMTVCLMNGPSHWFHHMFSRASSMRFCVASDPRCLVVQSFHIWRTERDRETGETAKSTD